MGNPSAQKSDSTVQGQSKLTPLLLTDVWNSPEAPQKKDGWKSFTEGMRHPVVLLVISSALIPFIIFVFNSRKSQREARQKKALEIVDKNAAFDGQLYSLYADLSNFYNRSKLVQGTPGQKTEDLKKLQTQFVGEFGSRSIDFSKTYSDQHLWVDDLLLQGVVLGLYSADDLRALKLKQAVSSAILTKLDSNINRYRQNVSRSVGIIRLYYQKLSAKDLDPMSPALYEDIAGAHGSIEFAGDKGSITYFYNKLHDERSLIVDDLVNDFNQ